MPCVRSISHWEVGELIRDRARLEAFLRIPWGTGDAQGSAMAKLVAELKEMFPVRSDHQGVRRLELFDRAVDVLVDRRWAAFDPTVGGLAYAPEALALRSAIDDLHCSCSAYQVRGILVDRFRPPGFCRPAAFYCYRCGGLL